MRDDEGLDLHIQTFTAMVDIRDYIASLPEPQKSLCHALVIEGESTDSVAGRFNVTQKTILRRTRKALAPLAVQFDIRTASKYLPVSESVIHVKCDGRVTARRIGAITARKGEKVGEASKVEKVLPERHWPTDHPGSSRKT